MKNIVVYLVLLIAVVCTACPWRSSVMSPECKEGIDVYFNNPPLLNKRTIEEMLDLQKCGLVGYLQVFFGNLISQRKDDVVPAILKRFDNETDENYKYSLIMILKKLLGTEHEKELISNKEAILLSVDKAIRNMNNQSFKKYATDDFDKVREFLLTR